MGIALRLLPIEATPGCCRIYAVGRDGRFPLLDTMQQWRREQPTEIGKLVALFRAFARAGVLKNREKVRALRGGLFEFKTTALRVVWFWDEGRIVVCTHGFRKQSSKTPQREIDRAARWQKEYFQAKKKGTITVVPQEDI